MRILGTTDSVEMQTDAATLNFASELTTKSLSRLHSEEQKICEAILGCPLGATRDIHKMMRVLNIVRHIADAVKANHQRAYSLSYPEIMLDEMTVLRLVEFICNVKVVKRADITIITSSSIFYRLCIHFSRQNSLPIQFGYIEQGESKNLELDEEGYVKEWPVNLFPVDALLVTEQASKFLSSFS